MQELLGEPLVLATQVELARAAAGIGDAGELEETRDGDVAEEVVVEHLHQVEDGAPGAVTMQAVDQSLQIAVLHRRRWRRRGRRSPARGGDLVVDDVVVACLLTLQPAEDGDAHA